MNKLSFYCTLYFFNFGCGLSEPKYEKYEESQTTIVCLEAQTVFNENVAPVIESTCLSCHVSTKIASSLLTDDNAHNREVLLKYDGSNNGTTLYSKIKSESHGGGDQSAKLTEAIINQWQTAEANCNI